jgi:hypothetical protein
MKRREYVLLLILLALIGGAGYYFFIYTPMTQEIEGLNSRIERKALERDSAEMRAVREGVLAGQLRHTELLLAKDYANVPGRFDDTDVIARVKRIIPSDANVRIDLTSSETLNEMTAIYTAQLHFTASFNTLGAVLRAFAAENTENRVVNLQYTQSAPSRPGLLDITMWAEFLTENTVYLTSDRHIYTSS